MKATKHLVRFKNPNEEILLKMPIREARIEVRKLLDFFGEDYASIVGLDDKNNIITISGVRSSKMKHFSVATATRG